MRAIYLISIYIFLPNLIVLSQKVSGKVVDENNSPMAFANVFVLTADSMFITGSVTDQEGVFAFDTPADGHFLKISYIGYKENLLRLRDKEDFGIITLAIDSKMLNEVIVKGNLPVIRLKGEAIVTTVENTVLSEVGSANDVIGKLPGVTRGKESFEVFGKGVPLIYINGKKVRDSQELEQLNSSEIKHIELITNPGARYDATVKSVIRVQTLRRKGEGLGVDLRTSYYQSRNTDLINQLV